jgi:hypothetical protein
MATVVQPDNTIYSSKYANASSIEMKLGPRDQSGTPLNQSANEKGVLWENMIVTL